MAKWSEEAINAAHTQRQIEALRNGPPSYGANIDKVSLKESYLAWSLDRSVSFGKYLHDKHVKAGFCTRLYYASDSDAYNIAYMMIPEDQR